MFQGKKKAITFSFDDGVEQDIRFISILDKYGLKGTFNLCSGRMGMSFPSMHEGKRIEGNLLPRERIYEVYKNHEVAVHTYTHSRLTVLSDDEVRFQVCEDKRILSDLVGYEVVGMAYPCGGVNNDDRVAKLVGECGMRYARTTTCIPQYDPQDNLLRYNPTVNHLNREKMMACADEFLRLEGDTPKILYVFGHAYELDYGEDGWAFFEEFCKKIAGKADIFYGTNREILLAK